MKSRILTTILAATLALPVAALGEQASNQPLTKAQSVEARATVTAIDPSTRMVTLKTQDGQTVDIEAGPAVKNFDQIKVGDQVVASYVEALTLELKKGGGAIRQRIEREDAVAAKPGEKPGVAAGRRITAIADVIALDPKKQTVRLRGPRRIVDLKVSDPNQFALVKVGDQVEVTFTEAMALSVEPMAARAVPKAAPKK